jgi:hypothetical protein
LAVPRAFQKVDSLVGSRADVTADQMEKLGIQKAQKRADMKVGQLENLQGVQLEPQWAGHSALLMAGMLAHSSADQWADLSAFEKGSHLGQQTECQWAAMKVRHSG